MLILFLHLIPHRAVADQAPTDFDFTGKYAINYGMTLNSPEYEFSTSPLFVGGPGQDDDYGYALQFTISAPTNISSLDLNATVLGTGNQFPDPPTTFIYQLYSGSNYVFHNTVNQNEPTPDLSTLLLQSGTLSFADSYASYNELVPFDVTLQPGTYWLAEQGEGGAIVKTDTSYIDPPFPVAPVPEPPSFYLLLTGLAFLIYNRRKSWVNTPTI